jgi:hypothetical protein
MSHPKTLNQNAPSELLKQLRADKFIQLLTRTTLFHGVPPTDLPLPVLKNIYAVTEVMTLPKNCSLQIEPESSGETFIYEILSGYVKIYDRVVRSSEKRRQPGKKPPALLAWRIPGELLGDFQFTLPETKLEDYIKATDKCCLLKIPSGTIRQLAASYPQIYLNVASNLAAKAIKARIRAQILRLPNIECMVAKLFIELLDERKHDSEIPQCRVINGTFRIEDIAAFLGYEYTSTQVGIHNLINLELIKHYQNKKSGRFEICDLSGLRSYLEREIEKAAKQRKQKGERNSGKSSGDRSGSNARSAPASSG